MGGLLFKPSQERSSQMAEKIKIDVNEIKHIKDRLAEINKIDLQNIQWMDGNKPIHMSEKFINDWKFIGLGNSNIPDYMLTEYGQWVEPKI